MMPVLLLTAPALPTFADDKFDKSASSETRVFEIRTRYTNEGRLETLHKRFREHSNRLLKNHGLESIGDWPPPRLSKDGQGDKIIPSDPPMRVEQASLSDPLAVWRRRADRGFFATERSPALGHR